MSAKFPPPLTERLRVIRKLLANACDVSLTDSELADCLEEAIDVRKKEAVRRQLNGFNSELIKQMIEHLRNPPSDTPAPPKKQTKQKMFHSRAAELYPDK